MPLEDWSYRVEQAADGGDGESGGGVSNGYCTLVQGGTSAGIGGFRLVFGFFCGTREKGELAVSWRDGIAAVEWAEKRMTNEFVARAAAARPKAWLAWSSGKDSAWALHTVRLAGEFEVIALLTTVNRTHARVAMHAVRESLLEMQAAAAGLPLVKVPIPSPCSNEIYEAAMSEAMARARDEGVRQVIFGDLFLQDIRAYREKQLARCGMTPVFPLWGKETRALAEKMIAGGLRAYLTCVDPRQLERGFAGRRFDAELLAELAPARRSMRREW